MSLRPAQARWFETYVPHADAVRASAALAATGAVQLELDPRLAGPVEVERLRHTVARFRALAAAHAHELPKAGRAATELLGDPLQLADRALQRLQDWGARIDHVKAMLERVRAEARQLALLAECLGAMQRGGLDVQGLFRKTRFLSKSLFACPQVVSEDDAIQAGVELKARGAEHDFLFLADLPQRRPDVHRLVLERGCEQLGMPAWLSEHEGQEREQLQTRLAMTRDDAARLEAELKALRHDADLARAQANVDTLHWYLEHAAGSLSGGELCHVTGWTTALDLGSLQQALRTANIEASVRFPNPPVALAAPVTILDTWWSRPFQPLLGLWGTPGQAEVDPGALLAVIVPLLFGYMFPDVGHGLVLALFAGLAWRRLPRLRFLLPCGLAAMLFGVLFGEVFGLHGLVPPVWLRPMDEPLRVLGLPLLFGVGLMLLGLVFAGVEAHWRGELRAWLLLDGAVLLLYASALLGLLWPPAFWVGAWATLQYCVAGLVLAPRGKRGANWLRAMADLLLSLFELAINTLSFLRVGAFALAHAALSSAVLMLADATTSVWGAALIVLLGNLFAIVVEGLVVFVQTTRLVLFEFFIRFLNAEGRLFRPLRRQGATAPAG